MGQFIPFAMNAKNREAIREAEGYTDDNTSLRQTRTKPFDPKDMADMRRLRQVLRDAYTAMSPFRETRADMIAQFVGYWYGWEGAEFKQPVNMIEMIVDTFMAYLVPDQPRCLVSTPDPQLRPAAYEFELALNQLAKNELELDGVIEEAVLEAFFSGLGVVKVGFKSAQGQGPDGVLADVNQVFVQAVDFDALVFDPSAARLRDCAFIGNRYLLSLDRVRRCGLYDESVVKRLKPRRGQADLMAEHSWMFRRDGEKDDPSKYDLENHVELWDLWLPRINRIITITASEDQDVWLWPLRDVEYEGPETGPFLSLGFGRVPNRVMPVSRTSLWRDLNEHLNGTWRKLIRQANRLKEVTTFPPGRDEDARRVTEASDGEVFRMDDTQAVRNFTYGGPNPALSQFALNVRQMVSYLPGNIDLLAGLGPQSQTATQDELLSVAANRRVGRMQSRIVGFIREIFESVAWHCWYNPDARVPITKTIPGTDISLSQVWSPDPNEADFLEFQFRFDPYSLQNLTPVQRAQLIRSLFREDIMPMLPLLIQQGQMPDVVGYLTEVGKLLNIEVDKLIQMQPAQPPQQGQGAPGLLEKSPTSTRHYVRHNRPGMTRQGADAATGLALIGMARDQSANQRQTQVQEA